MKEAALSDVFSCKKRNASVSGQLEDQRCNEKHRTE